MDLHTILSEINAWPVEDRIELVQQVWDRLVDEGNQPYFSDDLKAEIDRRLAAYDANPDAAIPWEQVEAEALARLQR